MRLIALRFFLSGDAAPAVTSPLVMQVGAGPWNSSVNRDGNEKLCTHKTTAVIFWGVMCTRTAVYAVRKSECYIIVNRRICKIWNLMEHLCIIAGA